MSNPCLIVDVTDTEHWLSGPMRQGCLIVPPKKIPTVLHPTREVAEAEARRLVEANPSRRFAIFEACVLADCVMVPSHMTLGGAVIAQRRMAHLADIEDGFLPF